MRTRWSEEEQRGIQEEGRRGEREYGRKGERERGGEARAAARMRRREPESARAHLYTVEFRVGRGEAAGLGRRGQPGVLEQPCQWTVGGSNLTAGAGAAVQGHGGAIRACRRRRQRAAPEKKEGFFDSGRRISSSPPSRNVCRISAQPPPNRQKTHAQPRRGRRSQR